MERRRPPQVDRQAMTESVPLKDYIERIFSERAAALELAFKAQQEALLIATRNLDSRLEKLNELRQEVTQDRGNYVTRDKYDAEVGQLEKKLDQATGALNVARFLGAGGLAAAIYAVAAQAGVIK